MNTIPIALPSEARVRRSPLPDHARNPLILLFAIAVPQAILAALNLHSFYLMSGEVSPEQGRNLSFLFAFEMALFLGTGAYALRLLRSGRQVPWKANWVIFLSHAAYLAVVTLAIGEGKVVPASVEAWIVPSGQLVFHQWVFVMPTVFYSVLALSCFPTRQGRLVEIVLSIAATAGIPVLWYLGIQVFSRASLPGTFIAVLAALSSLVCLAGFLRLVTCLYVWADRGMPFAQSMLALVVGVAGPVGGLILNSSVPFPTDFQSPAIYGMAIFNGVLLMIPVTNHLWLDRAIWLGRCAMLPFTTYFFLVFLPFLPLSIPAMIIMGAGCLMLVPVALMIVHTRAVLRVGAMELRDGLGKWAVVWALAAVSIMPGTITGLAWRDRAALQQAMDYVYSPNYREADSFKGSLWFTQRALEHIRDQKMAAYLPFLTEFYDQVVFGGLTLSVPKMQAIHQIFFGQPMRLEQQKDEMFSFRNRRRMAVGGAVRTQAFPHNVKLVNLTTSSRIEDGCTITKTVLALDNMAAAQSEYVTRIQLPPGVLVSGYWLHVGTERVPGQIFEKKTAQWVYRMIRDVTRRDPGLLVYTAPNTLELRVFPFAGYEKRVTEIEFLSPPGLRGTVQIDSRPVEIASPSSDPAFVSGASRLILSEASASMLPEMKRRPYLHFIVDRSEGTKLVPSETVEAIRKVAAKFPEATACRVTAANYEFSDLTEGLLPLDHVEKLRAVPSSRWLSGRGALLYERAIKRGLLSYRDAFSASDEKSPWFGSYPIFVVLSSSLADQPGETDMAWFAGVAPDADGYFAASPGASLEKYGFDGKRAGEVSAVPRGVRVFRSGSGLAVVGSEGVARVDFPQKSDFSAIEVYDPVRNRFEPVAGVQKVKEETRYARGLAAMERSEHLVEDPSEAQGTLRSIIKASRSAGVLVPSSAYIVVENSAQWKMLKLKEQQKLGNQKDLDFMESPEPSAAVVALLAGVFIAWRGRTRARKSAPCGGRLRPRLS